MSGSHTRGEQYALALKRQLAAELADDVELCPRCGRAWIIPDTPAGRLGVCPRCWAIALAEAQRAARAELEARREYDAERARLSRLRRKSGRVADSGSE